MSFDQIDLQWFAAEDEGRTEDPSEFKLRKAREEGRIAKSSELNGSLVFFFCLMTLIILGKRILMECADVLVYYFNHVNDDDLGNKAFVIVFFIKLAKLVLPIAGIGIVAGIAGNVIQNKGLLFTPKAIAPKFSKILPKFGEYFKNTLFSVKGIFNVVKSLGKVTIIILVAYILIRRDIPVILLSLQNNMMVESVFTIAGMAAQILVISSVIFILISIPDYFVQRREFMQSMKMTKYEVKQEYKEMEGDPEIKAKLKQRQKEILAQNMPKAVREADVVITNPTHFAVSMKYDRELSDAPQITAKGEDAIALQMRQIARDNDVPIVENRPLARGLYTDTEVGDIIPNKYMAVLAQVYAEILKYNSKSK